ncbi:hypothetical protein SAMN05660909_00601 [Chitinophaga terrae (ex Kim and Jung 2007)]|jgi:hypothetical protein|uniref:Uncharacterized protein n=1 Tax=Chitinophaga terrae (ex Kim and Jung 2007) TaxID=408074 RepID=A0A1H3Y1S0_9BACT|nr:hypothetical protein [Chitinophaga terrae (ex Kim and Jung 2007)]MDQ0108100.1 hypothetical protein [Chitinophaga terrae (ex Kim and Jung 2007)]GEP89495.1 hypothetical protein CTE07_11400 [Chitinophaga terrae (ex Kim and Jung 2007)]SEA04762.1 hypothetical protein SAMN05660909_00601 [Chitinophaga terrae (ex Kim and Jung 2007)]
MAQLPKFMIADDPVTDPENEYIFHTEKPRFFAKRVEDDEENAHIDIVYELDSVDEFFKNSPDKKIELLEELGDWYYSYLDWLEDDGEEEDDEF